jgi:hypothetical protein
MRTRPRPDESQEFEHKCDSVTRCDHLEQRSPIDNNQLKDKGDVNDGRAGTGDRDESLNHTHLEKCPYCDYKEHPFYLKIHKRNAHPEQE